MSVEIPTTEGYVTIYDNEIATLSLDFPGIDIRHQLTRFSSWVSGQNGRKPTSSAVSNSVRGWLRRAKPTTVPSTEKPTYMGVEEALAECVQRGLVPPNFRPAGESEMAQLTSLKAMATCGWYRAHPDYEGEYGPPSTRRLWGNSEPAREKVLAPYADSE